MPATMVSPVSSSVEIWSVGILAAEAVQGLAQTVGAVALQRGHRHLDDRLRHKHAFQRAVGILRTVGVAASGVEPQNGDDVAGLGEIDVFALIGVHPHDPAITFLAAISLVEIAFALLDATLVHPHERERAVRVLHHLEGHTDHRLVGIGRQRHLLVRVVVGQGLDRAFQRRRKVSCHGVQQRLHALVLVGRPKENRRKLLAEHGLANHAIDQFQRQILLGQKEFHHLIAVHRYGFQQMLPGGLDLGQHVGWDRLVTNVFTVGTVEVQSLFPEQVDHAFEVLFQPDGKLHQHGVAAEFGAKLLHYLLGHCCRCGPSC